MKKFFSIMCAVVLVLGVAAGQVFAQAEYLIDGQNPLALTLDTVGGGSCTTLTITLAPGGVIDTPLISGGAYLTWDPSFVTVVSVTPADFTAPDPATPANPWDAGFTQNFLSGTSNWFLALGNFGTVAITEEIALCTVDICCVGVAGNQPTGMTVTPIPSFDTVVGDTTVWDPDVAVGIVDLTQEAPACQCDIAGPPNIDTDPFVEATGQYTASPDAACENQSPVYEYSTTCGTQGLTAATIDSATGLLTVPPYTGVDEICEVCALDTSNTNINTGGPVDECCTPVTLVGGATCDVEIALGRECPGEEIDDPAYNRPGRRGLAATCNDIIDFTVCSDCDPFDPDCIEWSIVPDEPFLSIAQLDDCCWRLTIDDSCDQLEKIKEYVVTVTDTCNFASDSVVIEIGKVIVDVQDSTVDPQSGSVAVDIDLINPENHARAVSIDIEECAGGEDNLVCTECTADPDRALGYTCSAAEQPDGSCRIVLFSTDPSEMIEQGRGPIATVIYDAIDSNAGSCVCLTATDIAISDQFNEDLCACQDPGEVCFKTCGDIYPQDCEFGGPCGDDEVCGDGVVDLFDILEGIDIILGLQEATLCQIGNADVPNGMPPYCGSPPGTPNCESDGDVDIFDVLVMIDKALGKANCCDYCNFGQIF